VILGTTPAGSPESNGITQFNAFITAYGAANDIPVVNYADALCTCVNATAGLGTGNAKSGLTSGYAFSTGHAQLLLAPNSAVTYPGFPPAPLPTAAGYALMTQMAQGAIASVTGASLTSGYLQDVGFEASTVPIPVLNENTVNPGSTIQFTPYGTYSDGATRPILNSNYMTGSSGTWMSNNPAVVSVTQTGIAYALSTGTAWISYVSPEGVTFSPWIVYVDSN
jgi:hypothetical protein